MTYVDDTHIKRENIK